MPRRITVPFVFLLAAVGLAIVGPARPVIVSGESMMPAYRDREVIRTVRVDRVTPGDAVLVRTTEGLIVKRVVLVEGERLLQIRKPEGWTDLLDAMPTKVPKGPIFRWRRVAPGHVVILGDNLPVSHDSREMGDVPIEWVVGKVVPQRPATADAETTLRQLRKFVNGE